jgi:hypothetical protein
VFAAKAISSNDFVLLAGAIANLERDTADAQQGCMIKRGRFCEQVIFASAKQQHFTGIRHERPLEI